ncbi:DNA translocase FtsK [Ostreibacterium oceani]|uniref:DNA translocase FtsK n=1 Tax=Ostreibacterium oceani TaxID=2654998 RepID=A0A6N7ETN2_9GAMM|nr:DNA translocase FtsK 4TM domain-containing protein [Ostreibacterium oceani]MPV85303.1 cell division protein FtsK [Ostreibacterium oceani]
MSNKPTSHLASAVVLAGALIAAVVAVFLFIALMTYHPNDSAWSHSGSGPVQNAFGVLGAWYSDFSFSWIGKLSYLVPIALLAFCVQAWLEKGIDKEILSWRLCTLTTAIASGCILWAKHDPSAINSVALTGGGALGAWLAIGLEKSIGSVSIIMALSTAIFLISLSVLFNIPWLKISEGIGAGIYRFVATLIHKLRAEKSTANAPKKSHAIADTDDNALQEKIRILNKFAEKKRQTSEPNEASEPRRHFTISDYHHGHANGHANRHETTEQSPQQTAAPTMAANTAQTDSDLSNAPAHEKSEPTFFNFDALPDNHSPSDDGTFDAIDTYFDPRTLSENSLPENSLYKNTAPDTAYHDDEDAHTQPVSTDSIDAEPFVFDRFSSRTDASDLVEPSPALAKSWQEPATTDNPAHWDDPITAFATESDATPNATPKAEPNTASNTTAATQQKVSIGKAYEANTAMTDKVNGKIRDKARGNDSPSPSRQPERPYQFPPASLLDEPPAQKNAYTEDTLADMAGILERTLKQFNVEATVMHVSPGPVITRFEVDLAPGVQARKITALSTDLARALAVNGVRVEEVIPGSSYVGLEVPNKQRQIVYFKDAIRSAPFQDSQSPLTLSLGADISGKPVVADLMKMPHLLVAGTTGSGKSVCINTMLLSMLYKASPKDLRLILVDPKMLEMSMYADIPHLLTPVITDMNEAENALTWAVGEMERRYQLMAAMKVRKIDAFNQLVDDATARGETIKDPLWEPNEGTGYTHHPDLARLPFIVIVIDELADMMMVVGKQVEQLIARLTQKARAAGIHVILATQRPSVDVLTGLIKANVPTRIAFQVSSKVDSRTIIDGQGAEYLLGHGDMLYVPPGVSHPQRLHGAFVDDAETDRVTDFIRAQAEPNYINSITAKQDPASLGAFGASEAADKEDADPLYPEAIEIVLTSGKASISSVQRQLRIGYNRAARMIEDMQAQGIVSEPVNGVRKVLGPPQN